MLNISMFLNNFHRKNRLMKSKQNKCFLKNIPTPDNFDQLKKISKRRLCFKVSIVSTSKLKSLEKILLEQIG